MEPVEVGIEPVQGLELLGRERRSEDPVAGVVEVVEPRAEELDGHAHERHVALVDALRGRRSQRLEQLDERPPHVRPDLGVGDRRLRTSPHASPLFSEVEGNQIRPNCPSRVVGNSWTSVISSTSIEGGSSGALRTTTSS